MSAAFEPDDYEQIIALAWRHQFNDDRSKFKREIRELQEHVGRAHHRTAGAVRMSLRFESVSLKNFGPYREIDALNLETQPTHRSS